MKNNNNVTLEFFEKEFSQYLPTETHLTQSLSDEPEIIDLCRNMLCKAFPAFDTELINTMLLGCTKYNYGGIGNIYGDCALHTVYNNVVYYLTSGKWIMGLDKATIEYPREIRLQGVNQISYNDEQRLTTYIQTQNILLACVEAQWHYTGVLLKNLKSIKSFIQACKKAINKGEQHFIYDNIQIDCQDLEFIGNGFSSANMKEII